MRRAAARTPRVRELGIRSRHAAGRRCRTRRGNAHRTGEPDERELLYPWHPWARRQVYLHELVEKAGIAVFRCTLSGDASGRWQEVPAWMFDRAASTSWRLLAVPHVELSALRALASLLQDASGGASQLQETGAALGSHEANRGDVHAAPAHDTPVRSVLQRAGRQDAADAAMAGAAGGRAPSADAADGPPDPRPRRRRSRRATGGRGS